MRTYIYICRVLYKTIIIIYNMHIYELSHDYVMMNFEFLLVQQFVINLKLNDPSRNQVPSLTYVYQYCIISVYILYTVYMYRDCIQKQTLNSCILQCILVVFLSQTVQIAQHMHSHTRTVALQHTFPPRPIRKRI